MKSCPAKGAGAELPFYVGEDEMDGEKKFWDLGGKLIQARHADIFEKVGDGLYSMLRLGAGGGENRKERESYSSYEMYQLSKTEDGILRWGESKGDKCNCATIDGIRDCIISAPTLLASVVGDYFIANCQTDVEYVTRGCCLTGYHSWSIRGGPSPEHYEGDADKVLRCVNELSRHMRLFEYNTILTLCRIRVMQGDYD